MSFEPRTYQATASIGACVAGLAVRDSVVVLHGGAGCDIKLHTLLHHHDPSGAVHERVVCTKVTEDQLVLDPGELLAGAVRDTVRRMRARLAVVTSVSFVEVAGIDREHVLEELSETLGVPAVYVVAPDFAGDLFEGYSRALAALAARFAEGAAGPAADPAGRVNLIGYFLDRPWREHEANLAEIDRLLGAIGLSRNVTLLDGSECAALERLADAELNLVLPGGEAAAEVLEATLGQPRLDLPLPMGKSGTASWLRAIAAATGRQGRAEALIAAEERRVSTILRRAAEPLTGRRVALFADGAKLAGLLGICRDVRAVPVLAGVLDGRAGRLGGSAGPGPTLLDDPSLNEITAAVSAISAADCPERPDLVVGTIHQALLARQIGLNALEFGFPCRSYQALFPVPYMGYEGVLAMASRMLEAIPFGADQSSASTSKEK